MTDSRLTPERITLYGTGWCPDCKRSKQFFGEQRVPYHYVDIDNDSEAMAFVEKTNNGSRSIPTIVFPDGTGRQDPRLGVHRRHRPLPGRGRGDAPRRGP